MPRRKYGEKYYYLNTNWDKKGEADKRDFYAQEVSVLELGSGL